MNTRAVAVTAALTLLLGGCADETVPPGGSPPSSSTTAQRAALDGAIAQRLDAAVNRAMTATQVPGAIVGVWGPDGDYIRAFGVADKATSAPMRADFFHRIGSETKTFTVTAVLQLADQGKVGLDDPIAKYIAGVPAGDKITLRQLARMQSGLPNYSANTAFQQQMLADPRRAFTPQELLNFAFEQSNEFAPGESFQYSNTNTVLLGLVVEKVSGQPLHDFIRHHILVPLGMSDTSFPTTNAFSEPHAQGYTVQTADGKETIATDWNPSWGWAAGAMVSTLDDLRIWAPALATGKLLSPRIQAERLQTVGAPGLPPQDGYGLGIFSLGGWIGHNGSLPGYQTAAVYLPEKQTTMVILLNTDIEHNGGEPSTTFATAITEELTPDHVYTLGAGVQAPDVTSSPTPTTKPR